MNRTILSRWILAATLTTGVCMAHAEDSAVEAAAPKSGDRYAVDASHSSVGFKVSHMVISKVRGNFAEYDASLQIDNGQLLNAAATIKVASVNTGSTDRDEHLRGSEFFNVAAHPEMTFQSTSITGDTIVGDLTLNGVKKSISLTYTLSGPVQDPWGNTKLGFAATASINRQDFGLTWSKALETGGLVVGDEIELVIDSEFAKK